MREVTHFKNAFNYLLQKKAKESLHTFFFFFLLEVLGKNLIAFPKKCDGI